MAAVAALRSEFARLVPSKSANGSDGPNEKRASAGSMELSPKVKVELARLVPRGGAYHEVTRDDKIVR